MMGVCQEMCECEFSGADRGCVPTRRFQFHDTALHVCSLCSANNDYNDPISLDCFRQP